MFALTEPFGNHGCYEGVEVDAPSALARVNRACRFFETWWLATRGLLQAHEYLGDGRWRRTTCAFIRLIVSLCATNVPRRIVQYKMICLVAHLHNLRKPPDYRTQAACYESTRPTAICIGKRRCPDPQGRPG